MNKRIIHAQETYKELQNPSLLIAAIFMLVVAGIIFYCNDFINEPTDESFLFLIFSLTTFKLFMVGSLIDSKISDLIFFWLHYIYKGKLERNIEIAEFFRVKNLNRMKHEIKYWENEIYDNIDKNTLYDWVKLNVSEHKSIIKVISDRVLGELALRKEILYWSQLIPINLFKLDNLRTILLANKIHNRNEIKTLKFIRHSDISNAFSLYSEDELLRIFTSSFSLKDYCEILNFYGTNKEPLAVKKSITTLSLWVSEKAAALTGQTYFFSPSILENQEDLEYLSNIHKLENTGIEMGNCIFSRKTKCLKGESFCYLYYENGEPSVVFELSKIGKLIEAKVKNNGTCTPEQYSSINNLIKNKKLITKS